MEIQTGLLEELSVVFKLRLRNFESNMGPERSGAANRPVMNVLSLSNGNVDADQYTGMPQGGDNEVAWHTLALRNIAG